MSALASVVTVGVGVASHLAYFKHGEHHHAVFRYIQAVIAVYVLTALTRTRLEGVSLGLALASTTTFVVLYFTGLFTSLLVWRIFFNPLNKIPGPFRARITKFHSSFLQGKLDRHHWLKQYHEKYGKFVRIGPNDISVIDTRGISVISSSQSKCYKSPWYESGDPSLRSLQTTRDRADHERRRRVWVPAFSDKALREYEVRIQQYNDLLLDQIEARIGQPMDMSLWFNLYSFDVMGDLGFGQSFHSLEEGKMHWAILLLDEAMEALGMSIPEWFFTLLVAIPGGADGYHRFVKYCQQKLNDRMTKQGKQDVPDISHVLIDDFEKNAKNKAAAMANLYADTMLIVVAGSDTTSATFTHLFYYLAKNPAIQAELRREIESLSDDGSHVNRRLQDSNLLNGAINEALRLHPPVPSGLYRKAPLEGVHTGETYIPGNTNIQIPQYVLGHDEKTYTRCDDFIPERWSSQPELIKDKEAFAPFSIGPYNCIGKNLAYIELRTLTAQLLDRFEVTLAPGEDGSRLLRETKDHFTTGLAPLDLVFTKRAVV